MGFLNTMINSLVAGYTAARRVFEDPSQAHQEGLYLNQSAMYNLLWAYYNNSMFERLAATFNGQLNQTWQLSANGWQIYKMNYNLYRNIRMIYNPTRRLVNFYAGQVYPGVLSVDGKKLPDGVPLAVPFSEDTSQEVKTAVGQWWEWSNWQARKSVQVRYGAALGSALIEIVDDVEHGTVGADIVWPGWVSKLELDTAGNVKSYALEYMAVEEVDSFIYRKEVDGNNFRYFRNGEPFNYGDGAVVQNPYGFVPAVWIKHVDVGAKHGAPAISGSLGKIDELNGLASHIHDQIHKAVGAPVVFWSKGNVTRVANAVQKRIPSEEMTNPTADQESVLMLQGPEGGRSESLLGNLNLSEADAEVGRIQEEIEKDFPELTVFEELRKMTQVTGPAAQRLVAPAVTRLLEAAANYDRANVKLFQMALAIAGFRANSGAWGPLSRQQQKFTPFNLDSYDRGDLDMEIMPRPLLVPTRMEIGQENELMWRGVYYAAQASVPPQFVLEDAGWTEEKIAELAQATSDQQAQQQAHQLALSQAQGQVQQQLNQQQQPPEPMMNGNKQQGGY